MAHHRGRNCHEGVASDGSVRPAADPARAERRLPRREQSVGTMRRDVGTMVNLSSVI